MRAGRRPARVDTPSTGRRGDRGVDESLLVDGPSGWPYLPEPIAPTRLRLVRRDVAPRDPSRDRSADASSGAYRSRLTITFDDGRVLTGDEATEFVRQRKT